MKKDDFKGINQEQREEYSINNWSKARVVDRKCVKLELQIHSQSSEEIEIRIRLGI